MSATTRRSPPRLRWRQQRTRGALLSWDDFGSSVERTAKLHPLWQALCMAGDEVAYVVVWMGVLAGGNSGL
jgi:hypothetical protein